MKVGNEMESSPSPTSDPPFVREHESADASQLPLMENPSSSTDVSHKSRHEAEVSWKRSAETNVLPAISKGVGEKRGAAMSYCPPPRKCQVCLLAQSKYKCPNCLAPYCSLACFKKHKETPCEKPLPFVEEQAKLMLPKRSLEVDEVGWVVDKKYLQLLANSSEIREALKNRDIQRTIQKIDSTDEPEHLLTEAMEGQVFRDFTEKILSIVSPQD